MRQRARVAGAALLWIALATGCSSIPKAAAMQARDVSVERSHPWRVGVRASGGQDFEFRISDAAFEQALRDSLVASGVFQGLVALDSGDYRLDVVLGDGVGVEGRELTVLWSLSRVADRTTVWQEPVTSRGRSHHFVGGVRGRRSLEYAARENIRLGIQALSRIELPPAP
ncbi:MAG: hypothetical protein ACQGVC_04945 [Myxococcota bacterium]